PLELHGREVLVGRVCPGAGAPAVPAAERSAERTGRWLGGRCRLAVPAGSARFPLVRCSGTGVLIGVRPPGSRGPSGAGRLLGARGALAPGGFPAPVRSAALGQTDQPGGVHLRAGGGSAAARLVGGRPAPGARGGPAG